MGCCADDVDEHVLSLPGPRTADGAPATGRRSGSVRLRQSGGMPTHGVSFNADYPSIRFRIGGCDSNPIQVP